MGETGRGEEFEIPLGGTTGVRLRRYANRFGWKLQTLHKTGAPTSEWRLVDAAGEKLGLIWTAAGAFSYWWSSTCEVRTETSIVTTAAFRADSLDEAERRLLVARLYRVLERDAGYATTISKDDSIELSYRDGKEWRSLVRCHVEFAGSTRWWVVASETEDWQSYESRDRAVARMVVIGLDDAAATGRLKDFDGLARAVDIGELDLDALAAAKAELDRW